MPRKRRNHANELDDVCVVDDLNLETNGNGNGNGNGIGNGNGNGNVCADLDDVEELKHTTDDYRHHQSAHGGLAETDECADIDDSKSLTRDDDDRSLTREDDYDDRSVTRDDDYDDSSVTRDDDYDDRSVTRDDGDDDRSITGERDECDVDDDRSIATEKDVVVVDDEYKTTAKEKDERPDIDESSRIMRPNKRKHGDEGGGRDCYKTTPDEKLEKAQKALQLLHDTKGGLEDELEKNLEEIRNVAERIQSLECKIEKLVAEHAAKECRDRMKEEILLIKEQRSKVEDKVNRYREKISEKLKKLEKCKRDFRGNKGEPA